ncbi:hypothetical protein OJ998_23310 [Solirubrobacter taibaiensis]|nr:hypothetical protein [Solirubrobacter taibaiensis]
MSEFPALKDALVRAAARRRRRRRTVGAAVPAFAIAAAAFVFAFASSTPPEQERVASPLSQRFSVFARPQTDADRALPERLARAGTGGTIDLALTRRVADGAYVLATREGSVCIVMPERGNQIKVSCGPVARAAAGDAPVMTGTAKQTVRLVADGTRDVIVAYGDGSRSEVPVRDNVIVVRDPDNVRVVSWTDAAGVRHVARRASRSNLLLLLDDCRRPIEPLPADGVAQATREALLNVDRIYPSAKRARVIGTQLAPPRSCPGSDPADTVAVRLRLDTRDIVVLMGSIEGKLTPYRLKVEG